MLIINFYMESIVNKIINNRKSKYAFAKDWSLEVNAIGMYTEMTGRGIVYFIFSEVYTAKMTRPLLLS